MRILKCGLCMIYFCFFSLPAWGAETLTMREAVEIGLKSNPSVLAAREALMASDYAVKSAKAAFGPSFSTQYGYTRLDERPRSFGVNAGTLDNWELAFNVHQPLFTGFNLLTTHERAILEKEQVASQIDNVELRLIVAIQDTFLRLLQARENVRSAEDSLVRLRSQLKVNTAFYEVGLRPKLDMLQAQVDVATAEQLLLTAENNEATLIAQLNTLLGKSVEADVSYVGELRYFPMPLTLEECLERAGRHRPDLRIARQAVMLAEKDKVLAAVPYYPQVAADFNYIRQGEDPLVHGGDYHAPSQWNAQVGMKWTFFEWGKTYYGEKQAEKNVSRLGQEYLNLENDASFEVKKSFLQIQAAEKRISAARQGLIAAKESYRMAVARYEAQVGTNTDVLDAQSKQTLSEASLHEALSDYERSVAELYGAMGQRNPELLAQ
ncbi:outer membrane protein TolC [Desulfomicrobium macestii]|uniref:Outer membrane protein TolC n=1 Tax=Desulfomicrobium macestii TaxID=90731 RepID=A0ABR9H314_9BACT|nr:TolC family protein [Desulfomicrobium macestii]MBE1425094.1 outer membrane protein TolC [Desulfomicrobium macestii]